MLGQSNRFSIFNDFSSITTLPRLVLRIFGTGFGSISFWQPYCSTSDSMCLDSYACSPGPLISYYATEWKNLEHIHTHPQFGDFHFAITYVYLHTEIHPQLKMSLQCWLPKCIFEPHPQLSGRSQLASQLATERIQAV